MDDDLDQALFEASMLPYGRSKTVALEQLLTRVPEGQLELAFGVRLEQIGAYLYGGEPAKMLVPFSWCVSTFDAHPELAERSDDLLWTFKWVPTALLNHPDFDLAHTTQVLDDMERRYRDVGHSMQPVHALRCRVAQHVGDVEQAAREFQAWWSTPRGWLSDCEGCDPTDKADYFDGIGDDEAAIAQTEGVLDGQLDCIEQPQAILTAVLGPLARTGRHEQAADAHRRAFRALRGRAADLAGIADHVQFCALTGNEGSAVEIVTSHARLLDAAPSPSAEMRFLAAGSLALRRAAEVGHDVRLEGRAGDEVAEEWAARARAIAARFDRRNGTDAQSRRIEEVLSAEDWAEHVPLSDVARRSAELAALRAAVNGPDEMKAAPSAIVDPTTIETSDLLDRAEAVRSTDAEAAAELFVEYDRRVAPADRSALDAGRAADGLALARALEGDLDEALELLGDAVSLLDAAGAPDRVLRARGRMARILLGLGRVDEASAVGEGPMGLLARDGQPHAVGWATDLAALMLAMDRPQEALQELSRPLVVAADESEERSSAAWLRGDVEMTLERPEDALASYREAIAAIPEVRLPWQLLWGAGRACLALGDAEAALGELVEAAARAGAQGERPAMLDAHLTDAYRQLDRSEEAIATGEGCVEQLVQEGEVGWAMQVRDVLAVASLSVGAPQDAMRHAVALTDLAEPGSSSGARGLELQSMAAEEAGDHADAAGLLERAAELNEEPVERGRLLVRAGIVSPDLEHARRVWSEADDLLEGLDDPGAIYWGAVLRVERATYAEEADRPAAAADLEEVERRARALDVPNLVAKAHAVRLDLGIEVDLDAVRSDWQATDPHHGVWYELGYALSDALEAAGREVESTAVTAELHAAHAHDD